MGLGSTMDLWHVHPCHCISKKEGKKRCILYMHSAFHTKAEKQQWSCNTALYIEVQGKATFITELVNTEVMILQLNYKLFLFIYLFIELHFSFFYALCHNSIHKSPIILYIYYLYISNALHKTSSPFFFLKKVKPYLTRTQTKRFLKWDREGDRTVNHSWFIYRLAHLLFLLWVKVDGFFCGVLLSYNSF